MSSVAADWEEGAAATPERQLLVGDEDGGLSSPERSPEKQLLVPQEGGRFLPHGLHRHRSNGTPTVLRWSLFVQAFSVAALLGLLAMACLAALAAASHWKRAPASRLPLQGKFDASSARTFYSQRAGPPVRTSCSTTSGTPACPAIGLFEQPEVHKVAAENILGVAGRPLKFTDMELVLDIVSSTFRNVSWRIQRGAPRLSVALQMIQLSDEQREAVLSCLRLMSNPRVQNIGLEVSRVLHAAGGLDPETIKGRIQERLRHLEGQIRQLRDEVVPLDLQRLWGYGHLWEMTLDMENLRVMAASKDSVPNLGVPTGPTILERTSLGVELGALQEGRALVDLMKQIARLSGQDERVPDWFTTVSGKALHRQLSCALSSLDANKEDLLRAWYCPLKFGSQGVDALRAVSQLPMKPMERVDRINLFTSMRGQRRRSQ